MIKKANKPESTFDLLMQDPKRKELFERGYSELIISETLLAAIIKDKRSARELAKAAKVSQITLQKFKAGNPPNIRLNTFTKIVDVLGYNILINPKIVNS